MQTASPLLGMVMIATVFPPMQQSVGGGIGAAICWIVVKYFFPRSRWIPVFAAGAGFIVGQLVVATVLISMGSYEPITVPDP
jgi:hypothetical protein